MKEYRVEKIKKNNFGKVMLDTTISGASIGLIVGFLSLCFKSIGYNSIYYYGCAIGSYFIGNNFYDKFIDDIKNIITDNEDKVK